ncbi:DHH family phosphoesterase [Patescibacteria group bacterium]|nr:DHH family phosphoesterase [Patescibacteria group bacterium]
MSLGGGHDRAAGGTFEEKVRVEKCLKKMHEWIEKNYPVLG